MKQFAGNPSTPWDYEVVSNFSPTKFPLHHLQETHILPIAFKIAK